jgi:hypothetical protein
MNSGHLEKFLYRYVPHFEGVYSSDTLPLLNKRQWSLVVNTAPSKSSGEHWVACRREGNELEFFCSYGSNPIIDMPESIREFMRQQNLPIVYNPTQLQQRCSSFCGEYCMFYLIGREFLPYSLILSLFDSKNQRLNDEIIQTIIREYFPFTQTKQDLAWIEQHERECRERE